MTPADVTVLIRDDMRDLHDARVMEHVMSLLVAPPRPLRLRRPNWPGGEVFNGFLVLDHPRSETGVLYWREDPASAGWWSLAFTARGPLSGVPEERYPRFLDAYFESKASRDVPIWRVREWRTTRDGAWVSGELPWDVAWARVTELRTSAPRAQYYCDHAVSY